MIRNGKVGERVLVLMDGVYDAYEGKDKDLQHTIHFDAANGRIGTILKHWKVYHVRFDAHNFGVM